MTDETKASDAPAAEMPAAAVAIDEPMEKAKANGYVEPPAPSRDQRVNALIAEVEHAMAHNAPLTVAMLAEMKALLTE